MDRNPPVTPAGVAVDYPQIILKPKEEGRLLEGHLWAFSNEVAKAPAGLKAGALADLYHSGSGFLGRGFYNPNSLIAFRILTSQKDDVIDEAFFEKRLLEAQAWREKLYPGRTAYRWVFGESDRLPGLVIDRYGDYLSMQILSAGMEAFRDLLTAVLERLAHPKGIVYRSDAALRELEGLPRTSPVVLEGEVPPEIEIQTENGCFAVDLLGGQKTGFYFDQRENRQILGSFCRGKKVLDAFCYSGGFGIAAGLAGAREVVFVDSSEDALILAEANAKRNALAGKTTFVEGDVLKLFEHSSPGGPYDVISIDPPAFARSKKHLPAALKAYEKLNSEAMSALPRGGLLATSSCSHHVNRELFLTMLRRAAKKAHRSFRLVEFRSQAKDHPILLSMPETEYLKFAILQVV